MWELLRQDRHFTFDETTADNGGDTTLEGDGEKYDETSNPETASTDEQDATLSTPIRQTTTLDTTDTDSAV